MVQDPNQSSMGMAPNVAAGLASLFTWLGGLIVLLSKPPQQWVRFVAVQSIVMFVAWVAAYIALMIIGAIFGHIPGVNVIIGIVLLLAFLVLNIGYFVLWLIQTIRAFQGFAQRFPVISDWTDRFLPAAVGVVNSTYAAPPSYTPPPPSYTPPPPSYSPPPPRSRPTRPPRPNHSSPSGRARGNVPRVRRFVDWYAGRDHARP